MTGEILSSPEMGELAKAMIKVQRALAPVCKDAENPFVKSRYATLNAVIDACRDALIAQAVWVVQVPVAVEVGHLGLMTKLVHGESGQWQSSLMVIPLPKNDPQGYGSALTYARRYGLATLVGLVSETDDDGEASMPTRTRAKAADKAKPPSMAQAQPEAPAGLPMIDGIDYQTVAASNGKACVIATGNARDKRPLREQAGFRWDGSRKLWWRYAA